MSEETKTVPLSAEDVKFISDRQNFDEQTYMELFNGFVLKPTDLSLKSEKALVEMTDVELLDWVHKMDDFVRLAKVAATSARVRLEDRKLQLTEKQREEMAKLDRQYKPKTVKERAPREAKTKEPAWKPVTEAEKKVAAAMKILGMTKEAAEVWVAAQTGAK